MNKGAAILEDRPPPTAAQRPEPVRFSVLGVHIDNVTRNDAVEMLDECIGERLKRPVGVFFVNSHTLNLAAADPLFRETLNSGDFVFADGTGVRWAARLQGVRVAENMVGTDFVPEMFRAAAGRGYSYFMLGADERTVAAAADYARREFPGWTQAGFHHGYLTDERVADVAVEQINSSRPDVLLVGMGNPVQEKWIHRNLARLEVPVCMGIGGLFDYWAGNVRRAPRWLRRLGHEWVWRLFQQPGLKAKRYLIGNPLFLSRVIRERAAQQRRRG